MKLVRFEKDGRIAYGEMQGDGAILEIHGAPFDGIAPTGIVHAPGTARLLAPVMPGRLFGAGLNYVSHIAEVGAETPPFPMLFMKPQTAVVGPDDPIVYPPEGEEVHYEGELAAVIGRKVRRISEADALGAVLGYTCGNDVSERTKQFAEMKMGCLVIGKGYDSFNPLGPVIATGLDPTDLELTAKLNGELRQQINTSDLLYSVAQLVSYLSQAITLMPGDVIMTGTPAGVGPVQPGDVVDIEISGIGVLHNPVVAEVVNT